jgi:hypothetical protein
MTEDRKILRLVEVFDEVIDEFEDVVVNHPARLVRAVEEDAPLDALLGAATTMCLPIGQEVDAQLCMACDHFIGCRRGPDGSLVVHCWSHKRRERLARGTAQMPVPIALD